MYSRPNRKERGFALLGVLMLSVLLMALVAGYFSMTRIELSTVDSSMDATRGFYAAEAGSNIRAEILRQTFIGYNRPMGESPVIGGELSPCEGQNVGSGDFACSYFGFQDREIATYLVETPGNPTSIVIPRGEPFQNLKAQEYRYAVNSESESPNGKTEAVLELMFKSRLVPMFQFAVFYAKDLEILPGPTMLLEGPVHTNGDLYLGSGNSLGILGQVTTANDLYHGRKNADTCMSGGVSVIDPENLSPIPACAGGRIQILEADVVGWNEMILIDVDELIVPPPEALDPTPGQIYWDKADLRIMLDLNPVDPEIQIRNQDDSVDIVASGLLRDECDAVRYTGEMYNNREGSFIELLDVKVGALLDCIHEFDLMGLSKDLGDTTEGGLVWYFGVDGPDSDSMNNYGVRVREGNELKSSDALAPEVQGLTVVTNQALYVKGNYNAVNKKPAAFLADSLNVLSNDWNDEISDHALNERVASNTTIFAAFLGGTDFTGGGDGPEFQDGGEYNGGLENYPRFHEKWSGKTLTYRGSFVSLNDPQHVNGAWHYGSPQYTAPNRDWGYDTDFNSAENLPPLSPRFVYLKQELFVREFEM